MYSLKEYLKLVGYLLEIVSLLQIISDSFIGNVQ